MNKRQQKLSEEELARLVEYFELLIAIENDQ